MKSLLEQVTIVILSRDRHKNLISTINYFNRLNVKLVVLHKTDIPLGEDKIPNNVFYEPSQSSFIERCGRAVDLIATPFAILSADDERYLPSGLEKLVKILINNKTIASVGGQAISISHYGKYLTAWPLYSYLNNYVNEGTDIQQRVRYHYSNSKNNIPFSAMYRMYRKEDFRMLLRLLGQNENITTPYITEVTAELFSLWLGNITYCNEMVWLRNWLVPSINLPDWQRSITFIDWWNDSRFQSEKSDWEKRLRIAFGSSNFKLLCDALILNRTKESFESKLKYRIRINSQFKYFFRKYFLPKSLPLKVEKVYDICRERGIAIHQSEIEVAIKSML